MATMYWYIVNMSIKCNIAYRVLRTVSDTQRMLKKNGTVVIIMINIRIVLIITTIIYSTSGSKLN